LKQVAIVKKERIMQDQEKEGTKDGRNM
jgi:hypothetical protein